MLQSSLPCLSGDFYPLLLLFRILQKYLKVSRLIKRRTIANEACDAGRVMINGKVAKAGAEVKEGDEVTVSFGNRVIKIEVLSITDTVRKEEAKDIRHSAYHTCPSVGQHQFMRSLFCIHIFHLHTSS